MRHLAISSEAGASVRKNRASPSRTGPYKTLRFFYVQLRSQTFCIASIASCFTDEGNALDRSKEGASWFCPLRERKVLTLVAALRKVHVDDGLVGHARALCLGLEVVDGVAVDVDGHPATCPAGIGTRKAV